MAAERPFVHGVQAARALAVAMVIAAHVVGLWTGAAGFRWFPWQLYLGVIDLFRIDHQAGGHTGLLLFFLLSGYIVSQAAEADTRLAFVAKRAARLLPAMIIAVPLALLMGALALQNGWPLPPEFHPDRAFSWFSLLEAVGLATTFGGISALFVLWSLNVEYYWYALLATTLGPVRRQPVVGTLILMSAVLALYILAGLVPAPLELSRGNLGYVVAILIGRWVYLVDRKKLLAWQGGVAIVASAGVYALLHFPEAGHHLWAGPHPRLMALGWAIAVFVGLLRFVRKPVWRPVGFVAEISYGLYLYHIPVMFVVMPIVSPAGRWFPLGIGLTIGLTTVLAWASYRFIETPIRHGVRRLIEGPQATIPPSPPAPA